MTRTAMMESMSSAELSEWMAYYIVEPFGPETQYIGPAITSTVLANVNRKKGSQKYEVGQFMPKFAGAQKQQTDEELQLKANSIFFSYGGKDMRTMEDED